MEEAIHKAVKRAIATMRENLGEALTVDDMARAAMFSKFHFTRIFQQVTGISPGRFLSALRLHQAQHLLVSTSLNVADISQQVGYSSVGTFSSRFSRSVGMSPTTYRRQAGFAPRIVEDEGGRLVPTAATVRGHVVPHGDEHGSRLVFAGLFPDRIPQGRPARCAVLSRPGAFVLRNVPPGTWYLLAQSVPGSLCDPDGYRANINEAVSVASHGPLTVRPDSVHEVSLAFNRARVLDPPVLLAMLDVRQLATEMVTAQATPSAAPLARPYHADRRAA
ncbi:AraC family transcriptional regulator [Actinoplanes sp. NPDC051475]|uniref:AraC family transcriptional regulator n=1 Tax=Actinoplanes sp. NPDC051475 TaxID=3157225 RepID=UPI003450680B